MGIDFTIFVVGASKKLTNYEESQVEKLVKQMVERSHFATQALVSCKQGDLGVENKASIGET